MTFYKTAKISLPQKSSSISCIAKKAQSSTYGVTEGGEKVEEHC